MKKEKAPARRYLADDPGILTEVVMEAQSRFDAQIQQQNLSEHRHNFLSSGVLED